MKPSFYIIRPDMGDELKGCCNCGGPYATITAAREYIRECARYADL